MNSRILFQDDSYLVEATVAHPGQPFVVGFSWWHESFDPEVAGAFSRVFARDAVLDIGLNSIEIVSARNDWYQGSSIEEALAAARHFLDGSPSLTYGSSMGGYAAINFSRDLGADAFLALSPQCTISHDWLAANGDPRWAREALIVDCARDRILSGHNREIPGLIFHDDQHKLDHLHADACARHTRGIRVPIPYGGHPVSSILHSTCGLQEIVRDVAAATGAGPTTDLHARLENCVRNILARHRHSFFHEFCFNGRIGDLALKFLATQDRTVTATALRRFLPRFQKNPPQPAAILLACQVLGENAEMLAGKPHFSRKLLLEFIRYHEAHGLYTPRQLNDLLASIKAGQPADPPDDE